jgi:hypothetical protein
LRLRFRVEYDITEPEKSTRRNGFDIMGQHKNKRASADAEEELEVYELMKSLAADDALNEEPRRGLAEILEGRTLTFLRGVARAQKIRGFSRMDRAALLAAVMAALTDPDKLRSNLLSLHALEWTLFQDVAAAGILQRDSALFHSYLRPRALGLIFIFLHNDHIFFVVPDEIRAIYAGLKKSEFFAEQELRRLMSRYASAAAELYGAISVDTLTQIFNSQNSRRQISLPFMIEVLSGAERLDIGFVVWNGCVVSDELASGGFDEVESLFETVNDMPRYIPGKAEFLSYADPHKYLRTPQTAALIRYLDRELGLGPVELLEDIVHDISDAFRIGLELPDIIDTVIDAGVKPTTEQARRLTELVEDINDHTRRWEEKGHTPRDLRRAYKRYVEPLREPAEEAPHRIGRNDPCPCGSGKKYKKCCYLKENIG